MTVYFVKARKAGSKGWAFLTSKGGTNRLRVHAARFPTTERANAVAKFCIEDNPSWEFRVVAEAKRPLSPCGAQL